MAWAGAATAVAGFAFAGCGGTGDKAATAAKPKPAVLSIEAIGTSAAHRMLLGHEVILHGGAFGLHGRLSLEADPYPFDGHYTRVATGSPLDSGEYGLEAKPDRNTRFRIRQLSGGDGMSRPLTVFVLPSKRTAGHWVNHRLHVVDKLTFPRDLRAHPVRFFYYVRLHGSKRLQLISSARLRKTSPGHAAVRATLDFDTHQPFNLVSCTKTLIVEGMGGGRQGVPCGAPSFRANLAGNGY
jgi:hypothetical protein